MGYRSAFFFYGAGKETSWRREEAHRSVSKGGFRRIAIPSLHAHTYTHRDTSIASRDSFDDRRVLWQPSCANTPRRTQCVYATSTPPLRNAEGNARIGVFVYACTLVSSVAERDRTHSKKKNIASSIRTWTKGAIVFIQGVNTRITRGVSEEEEETGDIRSRVCFGESVPTSLGSSEKSRGRHFKSPLLLRHCTHITHTRTHTYARTHKHTHTHAHTYTCSSHATHMHTTQRTHRTHTWTRARWLVGFVLFGFALFDLAD